VRRDINYFIFNLNEDGDSSVDMATHYGLDGPLRARL
jgi:hypothetical protein